MYYSPITEKKLKSARAGGMSLWYCPDSGGRLITLSTAKRVFKVQAAKEIWIRANLVKKENINWKKCPCCSRKMTFVKEPKWDGEFEIDVCTSCRVIWLDKGEHTEVPDHADLLTVHGDSTIISDTIETQTIILEHKERIKQDEESIVGKGPDSILKNLFGFLSLPVEMNDHGSPRFPILTWLVASFTLMIHIYFTRGNPEVFEQFGFYPKLVMNSDWTNYIVSSYLHADWFHLISNLYFFIVFADDIEVKLGRVKYVMFLFFAPFLINILTSFLSFSPESPHIGLSGVISGVIMMYGLSFSQSRIAFLFPHFKVLSWGSTGTFSMLRAYSWFRIKAKYLAIFYVLKDLIYYCLFELNNGTNVSHSGHLSGFIIGLIIWGLFMRDKETIN